MAFFKKKNKKITEIEGIKGVGSLIKIQPTTLHDVKKIVAELLNDNVVLVNFAPTKPEDAPKIIDMLVGALLVTKGEYKKVSSKTYLFAPKKEMLNVHYKKVLEALSNSNKE